METSNPQGQPSWHAPYAIIERLLITTWASYTLLTFLLWKDIAQPWRYQLLNMGILAAAVILPHITLALGALAVDIGRMGMILLTCFASYEWVAMVIDTLPARSYEHLFLQLDHLIFRGNPSVWMQALHTPALTEYFQIIYVGYFPTLLLVGISLVVERRREVFTAYCLALLSAVIFNHICYVMVPVRSPFLIAELDGFRELIAYSFPLKGLWYAESLRAGLLQATAMRYDCFPSGHTMHSLIAIYFAWQSNRFVAWLATLLGVSIIASTLYLRYHYGVDLIAGALGAWLWITMAGRLLKGYVDPVDRAEGVVSSLRSA